MLFFHYLHVLLVQYVVPFLFAIGVVFLVYAVIYYFIIGAMEEPNRDEGRLYFIKANVWFFAGLCVYLLVFGVTSLVEWGTQVHNDTETGASATIDSRSDVLPVPNVPTVNE